MYIRSISSILCDFFGFLIYTRVHLASLLARCAVSADARRSIPIFDSTSYLCGGTTLILMVRRWQTASK